MVVGFRGILTLLACCVFCVLSTRLLAVGAAGLWSAGGWMLPASVLALLLVATTAVAVARFTCEVRADRRLRREVRNRAVLPDGDVRRLARRAGLAERVTVVPANESFAFTHGLVTPRVVVSSGLVRVLDTDELAAVLAHEAAHVRARDPLKVLVARVLMAREFYLPALRHLSRTFVAGRELAADRQAVCRCGTRPVAGALMQVLDPPRWAAATPAAAMASAATVDARISQLETGAEPAGPRAPRLLLFGTVGLAGLVLAVAIVAAIVVEQICMRTM